MNWGAGQENQDSAFTFEFQKLGTKFNSHQLYLCTRFAGIYKIFTEIGALWCANLLQNLQFFRQSLSLFSRFGQSKSIKTSWEQNLTTINYIYAWGFLGFTKHSRRSEHFGAQICNTMGSLCFNSGGFCVSKLLISARARQPTIINPKCIRHINSPWNSTKGYAGSANGMTMTEMKTKESLPI